VNEPRQTQAHYVPVQTQTVALDDESIVDIRSAANFLGYLMRSMRRRKKLMVTTSAITLALVTALAMVMPRSYRIETRILTHKSGVMSALVHPGSSIPPSADNPTGGAVELIKSRDNLSLLMEDIHLQELWASKRSAAAKFKDTTMAKMFGEPKPEEMTEAYLTMLDDKITASIEGDVVLINVEWPDAMVAKTLAEAVQARFLNMRHKMELSEIGETVQILSRNVETSRVGISEVVKRMQKIFEQRESDLENRSNNNSARNEPRRRSRKSRFLAIRKPTSVDAVASVVDAGKVGGGGMDLAMAKRAWETRFKRAQDNLASLQASLGPDHPDVMEAKRNVEVLGRESASYSGAEAEAAMAAVKPQTLIPRDDDKPAEAAGSNRGQDYDLMRVPVSEDLYKEMDKDPEIAAVLDDLKKRQDAHDVMVSRLVNANLQSETANVAFNYRYIVTEPPVMPRKPVKPNVPVLIIGGAVGGVVLGVLLALLADIFSGRILETWQVTRFLQMKALGELEEP
jgi:succinoglycan biosynthesis transport protein ExoP